MFRAFSKEEQMPISKALETILWTLMAATLLLLPAMIEMPAYRIRWLSIIVAVNALCIALLFLNRRGRTRLASFCLIFGLWAVVTVLDLTGIGSGVTLVYAIIVFIAGVLLGARAGILAALFCILTGLGQVIIEISGSIPPKVVPYNPIGRWINLVVFITIMIGLQYLSTRVISNAMSQTRHESDERKRVEEALRRSESRWYTIFNDAVVGIALLNKKGYLFDCNPALERMLGYSHDELSRMSFLDFTRPDDAETDLILYNELIEGQREFVRKEKLYVRKDGQLVWGNLTASIIHGEQGQEPFVVAMVEDITERKVLEERLRQSQKLEAVGQLAGGIAHDFNNMLTAIIGYSELGLRKLQAADPLRHTFEEINRAGARAASLTGQLLAFSRKQILQPKVLDLNSIISSIQSMLERLIGEDIVLQTKLEPALGSVKADPGQMEQVILNLVLNARDAMPRGGNLTIETSNLHLEEEYIETQMRLQPGSYVRLVVSDNGSGIDEKTQARIFEPFFTTKEMGKGTGLGLSTVYGVVKQSGGHIWVYSESGHGTTFKIYLPLVDEKAQEFKQNNQPKEQFQGTQTILLVEDEEIVRKLVFEVLRSYGYEVLATASGAEAILLCEQHPGPIHLLITDVVMPEMSGLEVADRRSVIP